MNLFIGAVYRIAFLRVCLRRRYSINKSQAPRACNILQTGSYTKKNTESGEIYSGIASGLEDIENSFGGLSILFLLLLFLKAI